MNGIRKFFLFLSAIIVLSMFFGCATAPAYDPARPILEISQASGEFLKGFGRINENPYLEPKSLLRGKLNEFFVVRMDFNLPEASRIAIIAEAFSDDGKEAARAYDLYSFIEFWDYNTIRDDDNDSLRQRKITYIERSCIPSMQFNQRAGKNTLLVPFVGKNPIPRPATIYVQVAIGGGEPFIFEQRLE
jgi:hypothetical protein